METETRPRSWYTTPEACQLAGVSYRQLDYWSRRGLLVPSITEADGSGSQRRYSSFDVAQARVLGRLSALGIKPGQIEDHETLADLVDHLLVELHALEPLARFLERSDHATEDHRGPD